MKQTYIIVSPVTPKGKFLICANRAGSKDKFYQVADAPNETLAESVRSALAYSNAEQHKAIEEPGKKAA